MGAAAAMLFSALLDELEKRSLKRGLIAFCLDGGQGIAIIIILNNVYI
jgi:acetyl-CoA C-acetyltransferase